MIVVITTMAVILDFSSWGLAFDVSTLFRFSESCRSLFVANGFHIDCSKLAFIIDGLAVLINRLAVNRSFASDCIPLSATGILKDLIVTTGCCKSGCIIELGSGAILMTNLEVSVLTMLAIHLGYRQIVTRHKVLECRLIVSSCSITGLKLGNVTMLLHCIPVHTIGRLHNRVGCIGFLEISAVVPQGVASIGRACLDNTVTNRA